MTLEEAVARGVVARTPEMETLLELGRLRTRVAELEAALKPFGEYAEKSDAVPGDHAPDGVVVATSVIALTGRVVATVVLGDCRRAAAVFKGGQS